MQSSIGPSKTSQVQWDKSFIQAVAPEWTDYDCFSWDENYTGYGTNIDRDVLDIEFHANRANRVSLPPMSN